MDVDLMATSVVHLTTAQWLFAVLPTASVLK